MGGPALPQLIQYCLLQRLLEKPGPNPHAELDNVPLPDPSKAEQMIADLHAQDPEPPAVVNFAGAELSLLYLAIRCTNLCFAIPKTVNGSLPLCLPSDCLM